MMRALVLVAILAGAADARPMCGPNAKYHGAPLDLDVKDADVHDVYRLLADIGRINIVVADTVQGKVTMRLKHVPWDQVACTVAAVHKLLVTIDDNIVLVTKP